MSWVKQSDKLWSDPNFTRLTDGAQALRTRADSYIADHLLDGVIPEHALKLLSARTRYVQELVAKGFWLRLEAGSTLAGVRLESGCWLAVDWQERIKSRAEVLERRSETLQRVRKHRNAVTNTPCNSTPGPARPDPGPSSEDPKEEVGSKQIGSVPDNVRALPRVGVETKFRVPLPPVPPEVEAEEARAQRPSSGLSRVGELAKAAYVEAFQQRWACGPGNIKPETFEEIARRVIEDAKIQAKQGLRYELKSLLRCAAYRFQYTRSRMPRAEWILEENRMATYLHEGADNNPSDWRPVLLSDVRAEAAQ